MDKDDRIALLTELLIDTQKKALQELATIRKWVTFFGVLSVISLISGLIAAIAAMAR